MELVKASEGVWHLIDETAPPEANLIATVRGPVEAMALKELCIARLAGTIPDAFEYALAGRTYRATCNRDSLGKISLSIVGDDGARYRVETELAVEV
jgi:hypothetical protein